MSVALKWIEPEELGAYLKKGWTEVELRFEASGKYLIASPDEPASEPAKVECDFCCGDGEGGHDPNCLVIAPCEPAQPEPVAEEMLCPFCGTPPEIKSSDPGGRSEWIPEGSGLGSAGWIGPVMEASCRVCGVMRVPLSIWNKRTHAEQPAKVRMTEELQRVLEAAETQAAYHTSFTGENPALECREIRAAIAAVRAQAAEAGKVRMPKVRELLDHLYTEIGFSNKIDVLTQAAFAALDAVEGKGEGRG